MGENCNCCCPNTSFTFDVVGDECKFNTWNFQRDIPSIEQLQTITSEQIDFTRKLLYVQKNESLGAVVTATNQLRTLMNLPEMTDNEKVQLIPESTYFYPLV